MVTLLALTAIAAAIGSAGLTKVSDLDARRRRLEERLLLEAGLARGVLALVSTQDPMTEILRRDGRATWAFEGRPILISFSIESRKIDINDADFGAVQEVLRRSLNSEVATAALARLATFRAEDTRLPSPDHALPLAERFGPAAVRLRDLLTVYDGLKERPTWRSSKAGEEADFGHERPIFSLRASEPGKRRALAQTIVIDPDTRRYAVLDRLDLTLDPQ